MMRFGLEVAQVFCNDNEKLALDTLYNLVPEAWKDEHDPTCLLFDVNQVSEKSHMKIQETRHALTNLAKQGFLQQHHPALRTRESEDPSEKRRKTEIAENRYNMMPEIHLVVMKRLNSIDAHLQGLAETHQRRLLDYTFICEKHGYRVNDGIEFDPLKQHHKFFEGMSYMKALHQNLKCAFQGCGATLRAVESGRFAKPSSDSEEIDVREKADPTRVPGGERILPVGMYKRVTSTALDDVGHYKAEEDSEDDEADEKEEKNGTSAAKLDVSTSTTPKRNIQEHHIHLERRISHARQLLRSHMKEVWEPVCQELLTYKPLPTVSEREVKEMQLVLPRAMSTMALVDRKVIALREQPLLRDYQIRAAAKCIDANEERPVSGVIVMPCGSGKTAVGIRCMNLLSHLSSRSNIHFHSDRVLVVCNSHASIQQWVRAIHSWTSLERSRVAIFGNNTPAETIARAQVVLVTYNLFAIERLASGNKLIRDKLRASNFMLMILDEVHMVTADTFRKSVQEMKGHVAARIGLTATLKGEHHEQEVAKLVGPILHEEFVKVLVRAGHLSKVDFHFVECPELFDQTWACATLPRDSPVKMQLMGLNPAVLVSARMLIELYRDQPHSRVLVISDRLEPLSFIKSMCQNIRSLIVTGKTKMEDRERIYRQFMNDVRTNVLFLSKVGDMALDLPEASTIIQITWTPGSKPQGVQRAGRVQRPKRNGPNIGNNFVLVSNDGRSLEHAKQSFKYISQKGFMPTWMNSPVNNFDACKTEFTPHQWSKLCDLTTRAVNRGGRHQ